MSKNPKLLELLYEEESVTLDFKREQYRFVNATNEEKGELLKDIIAFANAWRRDNAFIVIGIQEIKGGKNRVIGVEEELDDAQLQEFINYKTQKPIDFHYTTIIFEDKKIGLINIPVQKRPFYLTKDFGKLKKDIVYIRRGTSTTIANPDEIAEMGRNEFQSSEEIPAIRLEFAENKNCIGQSLSINPVLLNTPSINTIPDFPEKNNSTDIIYQNLGYPYTGFNTPRKNFYREMVRYFELLYKTDNIYFSITNESSKAIIDITVQLIIKKQNNCFNFMKKNPLPDYPMEYENNISSPLFRDNTRYELLKNEKHIIIDELEDSFKIELPFQKVQPKQTIFSRESIYVTSHASYNIELEAIIYADNIPIPVQQTLNIACDIVQRDAGFNDIKKLYYDKSC